jgi:hypothetical protein
MAFGYLNKNKKSRLLFNFFLIRIGISFIVFGGMKFFFTGVHDDLNYFNIFTNRSDIRVEFWNNIYSERSSSEVNEYFFYIYDINRDQYF